MRGRERGGRERGGGGRGEGEGEGRGGRGEEEGEERRGGLGREGGLRRRRVEEKQGVRLFDFGEINKFLLPMAGENKKPELRCSGGLFCAWKISWCLSHPGSVCFPDVNRHSATRR